MYVSDVGEAEAGSAGERLHEALRPSVVIGVADAAHAGLDAMRFQHRGVATAGILDPAIGVMDEAAGRIVLDAFSRNLCEPIILRSASAATATAPSQAKTILNSRSPGSIEKTRLPPISKPVVGALWKMPLPKDRTPIS
jgi:hypothetical protein